MHVVFTNNTNTKTMKENMHFNYSEIKARKFDNDSKT